MFSKSSISLSILASLLAVSASPISERSIPGGQAGSSIEKCAQNTYATICTPTGTQAQPIGDHINTDLIATGLPFAKGISVALRSKKTGKRTQLTWSQRNEQGISDGSFDYKIITSHAPGIFYGDLGHGFHGEGQLPCSLWVFDAFRENVFRVSSFRRSAVFSWVDTQIIVYLYFFSFFRLDDTPAGSEEFEWLMTHYYGDKCTYTNPSACQAVLTDVPPNPISGFNSTITIKDNASICGRS